MKDQTTETQDVAGAESGDRGGRHPHRYDARLADEIERRWQERWERDGAFRTPEPDAARPKFYCLDMFPYPSGAGLHVGHPEGYTATDILCRYKRMKGFDVLHPMGFDAFGLPAEQYAIQTGVHPAITTRKAIDNFRRQLRRFGFSYDWEREIATIDEEYYRWTQWIWLRAYEAWYDDRLDRARPISELRAELDADALRIAADGSLVAPEDDPEARRFSDLDARARRAAIDGARLAYVGTQTVNWCPKLGTALANEEVIDGRSERGGYPVLRKPLRQWMFRITAYADRLERDLDRVAWPESTRTMQREWIGRSEGADVDFPIADPPAPEFPSLRVYTTRPDTIFGATWMVVAPEHPVVEAMLGRPNPGTDVAALREYVAAARNRADVERLTEGKDKTGIDTGFHCVNPATGGLVPIHVADYVLMGYGHGAIMAVPSGDQRDFDYATAFGLPVLDVVRTPFLDAMVEGCRRMDPATPRDRRAAILASVAAHARDGAPDWDALVAEAPETLQDEGYAEAVAPFADAAPGTVVAAAESRGLATLAGRAFPEAGVAVHSANDEVTLDGLATADAKRRIVSWLEVRGLGRRKVNYRLHDWLFSRQRYWGEPFPIVYDEHGDHHPVAPDRLPVTLPPLADYEPIESEDPVPLLAKATDWVETTAGEAGIDPAILPAEARVRRETNTMPGWAGSCWYYLRYCAPDCAARFVDRTAERRWMLSRKDGQPVGAEERWADGTHHVGGVDLYVGGAEHAVLHLLYARFWHKILFDLGEVSTPEPFGKLFHQGMITSYAYQRDDRSLVPVDEVDEAPDGTAVERATGERVTRIVAKMSKSLRNVVNPDDVIRDHGADTFRLYEMYMGPLEASKPWNTHDIAGPYRFLQRAWRLVVDEETGAPALLEERDAEVERLLHRTIAKVAEDLDRLAFNTAIAALIEFVNLATRKSGLVRDQAERFALALAPFAPHLGEELWSRLGHAESLVSARWPEIDPAMLRDDEIELPVQVLGKVRGRITVAADADAAAIERAALADERVAAAIAGKTVRKVIVVPGKIVNVIAG